MLGESLLSLNDDMAECCESAHVSQSVMIRLEAVRALVKAAGAIIKKCDDGLVDLHDDGQGVFAVEEGKAVLTFSPTTKCAPKWKDEAANLATKVASLEGDEGFTLSAWTEKVRQRTGTSTTFKSKITRGV